LRMNVRRSEDLKRILNRIDGRGYKAYKDCAGIYDFNIYTLYIDHVQGDPFASPSKVRVRVNQDIAGFPKDSYKSKSREIGLRDYLTREFYKAIKKYAKLRRGSGKSGLIAIDTPQQEILERSSCFINDEWVEVRFVVGLPAFGRRISAREAIAIFFDEIPKIVNRSLIYEALDSEKLYMHIKTNEDADYARGILKKYNLVSFIADGSILPRASGIDPGPLTKGKVIPFESPESMRVEINLPNSGKVTGMGIPEGVSLIVGGGYHGKSTLLRAIQLGVYNHIPGDGRELVVTIDNAVKVRAEDGRRIEKVDISPFIKNLPFGKDTVDFSTDDASGSTSQAANIIEALEIRTNLLIMDEDTSATNFMIRDHRMQELVSKDKEPITPFIDKVRQLYTDHNVSTILALGGSGDYFDVADRVLCMVEYRAYDYSKKAFEIVGKYKTGRVIEGGEHFGSIKPRIPLKGSFDPSRGKREVKITPKGLKSIDFGTHRIDLGAVEQLVDISQTRAVGDAIYYAVQFMDGKRNLKEIIYSVMNDIYKKGLDVLSPRPSGDYAMFRGLELAAAINRLRTLSVQ